MESLTIPQNLNNFIVLHHIPYLNDSSKAEQAQPGSRLREMNLYSEIIRDTSINTVSIPTYHPLFSFSPPSVAGQASRGRRSCREVTAQTLIADPMCKTV